MRLSALALCLAASQAIASPAAAVLKHYGVHWTEIAEFNTANPPVNRFPPPKDGSRPAGVGIVDDSGSGHPRLERLELIGIGRSQGTVDVPGLAGFIFLSELTREGPRKGLTFTGSGDTQTTVAWGLVTGWSVTGGFWCHSSPAFICTYARGKDLATAEPSINSPWYDLGTWTFHGTGFTSAPFISQSCYRCGNSQYWLRGRLSAGIVPALPVLGVTLLGASLLLAGARLARGRWPQ
jgi:hypothetical protein